MIWIILRFILIYFLIVFLFKIFRNFYKAYKTIKYIKQKKNEAMQQAQEAQGQAERNGDKKPDTFEAEYRVVDEEDNNK